LFASNSEQGKIPPPPSRISVDVIWGKGEERYEKDRENGEDMREKGRRMEMQRYWTLKG
jgi:hypothetical protein